MEMLIHAEQLKRKINGKDVNKRTNSDGSSDDNNSSDKYTRKNLDIQQPASSSTLDETGISGQARRLDGDEVYKIGR